MNDATFRDTELAIGLRTRTVRPCGGEQCAVYGCQEPVEYGIAPGVDRAAVGLCQPHADLGSRRGWLELDARLSGGK